MVLFIIREKRALKESASKRASLGYLQTIIELNDLVPESAIVRCSLVNFLELNRPVFVLT